MMQAATSTSAIAVFDIGKTNIKLTLVDEHGQELAVRRRPNQPREDGPEETDRGDNCSQKTSPGIP